MNQAAFSFTHRPDYREADFIISSANEIAYKALKSWPWNSPFMYIYGAESSGKTHLSLIWKNLTGAQYLNDFSSDKLDNLGNAWFLEDCENIEDEEGLFHFINHIKNTKKYLLITSRVAANMLPFTLPDLKSRIAAMPSFKIEDPDDELLVALLHKHFSDRQLLVSEEVVDYIKHRIKRSYEAIESVVENLDNISIERKSRITIPLVKQIL